jgi:hypothetical protein
MLLTVGPSCLIETPKSHHKLCGAPNRCAGNLRIDCENQSAVNRTRSSHIFEGKQSERFTYRIKDFSQELVRTGQDRVRFGWIKQGLNRVKVVRKGEQANDLSGDGVQAGPRFKGCRPAD